MRGIVVLGIFVLLAAVFKMHTILFLARNSVTVLATAAVVVFQPELRRALEKLGEKQFLSSIVPLRRTKKAAGSVKIPWTVLSMQLTIWAA